MSTQVKRPLRGEIWLVSLDPTIGREQAKTRPCVVVSADGFNKGPFGLFIVIPLTSKDKRNPLHIPIDPPEGGLLVKSFALTEHIRSTSYERFSHRSMGRVHDTTLKAIEHRLKILLGFDF